MSCLIAALKALSASVFEATDIVSEVSAANGVALLPHAHPKKPADGQALT